MYSSVLNRIFPNLLALTADVHIQLLTLSDSPEFISNEK